MIMILKFLNHRYWSSRFVSLQYSRSDVTELFFKTWEDFAKVLPFMPKFKSHFSKCKVCMDLAGRKSITASRRRRRGHLRFGVWRAGHGRAGGGRGGRPEGRVLADVLRLASLLLLLLRLHTSFPCWRYVRLLTGRGKRILAQTEYRAIRKYWMLDSIIWPQTTE